VQTGRGNGQDLGLILRDFLKDISSAGPKTAEVVCTGDALVEVRKALRAVGFH
jgi:hypothetical protein